MLDFTETVLAHEGTLRLSIFVGALIIMISAETLWPRRARVQPRLARWRTHVLIVVIDVIALRIIFPLVATGLAIWAGATGWGVLNLIDFPFWAELILALIVLDLAIYGQHVASHHVPLFWRFHKVHHTDRDLDASSALRFHPIEIIASMGYKMLLVLALGPSAIAVIVFEILLSASAIFNHANLRLPQRIDQILRRIIVTPDYHRVHHSTRMSETNSNYGFFLSVWDYIFRTYCAAPKGGHSGMTVGLAEYQDEATARIGFALALPFARKTAPAKRLP